MQRIALIGTGWVAGMHLQVLSKLPGVEVVGVAGRNPQRLAELTGSSGARGYLDYREMVEKEKPDGVYLTLPPHLHGDVEVYLAGRVKGVLIEKPLANTREAAERALAAFQKAGTLVSVGYQNRYLPGVLMAKQWFAASPDKPILVNGWWVGDTPSPLWWKNKQQSGGQFVEQCTHVVDLARYIVGDITEVQAFGTTAFRTDPEATVEDALTVNAKFVTGALGTFQTGCFGQADSPARPGIGLTIASRTAVIRFSGWGFDATLQTADGLQNWPSMPDSFRFQAEAFVRALSAGDRSGIASDYADGLASLKVGLAANLSLERGGLPVVIA